MTNSARLRSVIAKLQELERESEKPVKAIVYNPDGPGMRFFAREDTEAAEAYQGYLALFAQNSVQLNCGKCGKFIAEYGRRVAKGRDGDREFAEIALVPLRVVRPVAQPRSPNNVSGTRYTDSYFSLVGMGRTVRFRCHPKCGADWRPRRDELGAALLDVDAPRPELTLGVDLTA